MVELIMAVGFIAELGARWRDIRTAQPARGGSASDFPNTDDGRVALV
jgi:hypothetical protein